MPGADIYDDFSGATEDIFEEAAKMIKDVLVDLGIDLDSLPPVERKKIRDKLMPAIMAAYPRASAEAHLELESEVLAEAGDRGGTRAGSNNSQ